MQVFMQRFSLIAATIALVSSPASIVLAQGTPGTGAGTTPTAPAAAPASSATTAAEPAKPGKKKAAQKMTRQQEIDKSIDSGTVPARYRSSVPKQYHQYIPFDKR